MASDEKSAWRERERHLGAKDEGFIPVRTAGLYPLPSEGVRFVEPSWNLHGLLQDKECEDRFEQRMSEAEEQKVMLHEEEELHKNDDDDARKDEMERRKFEAKEQEEALAAEEKAVRAEANRAFAEEIERAVRELRVEANEQHLRAAEEQISTLHARVNEQATRRDKTLEEEEEKAEETYMASVQEQREQELELEEERRFDRILQKLDIDDRLERITQAAEEEERQNVERQDRRSRMQQENHVISDMTEEEQLEQLARLSEQAAREEEEGDLDDSHGDSKIVLQKLLEEAKAKHEEFKKELRERHLWFVEKLRQTAVNLNTEAEKKRKEEWAAGDRTFKESNEILNRARQLVDNMDTHVKQLNQEFKAIAERQDVWPMSKHRKPHSASAVEIKARQEAAEAQRAGGSAGNKRKSDPPRPMSSPVRPGKPEPEPVAEVSTVPTGFAHAIRIVFEHMDRKREGRLKEADVAEGLTLLGLDNSVSLGGLFGGVAGVDGIGFKEFQDMVLGVVGRAHTPARTPPNIGVSPITP